MPVTDASYTPREVRFAGCEDKFIRFGVIVAEGEGALPEGSILGEITSGDDDGKFALYDPTGTDGREVAKCILAQSIDATSAEVHTSAYVAGIFRESALGAEFDANAKNNLNARSYWNGAIILGGGGAW